ncbi:nicotinate-nicotinamide nucleotide adenylyltransferase [Candidatus Omnitrophota bacterium]
MKALKDKHPEWESVYFIIGADSIPEIYTWNRFEDLCNEVTIVVHTRRGFESPQRDKRFMYLESTSYVASSTEIRAKIRVNDPYEEFVPQSIVHYIKNHNLYRD